MRTVSYMIIPCGDAWSIHSINSFRLAWASWGTIDRVTRVHVAILKHVQTTSRRARFHTFDDRKLLQRPCGQERDIFSISKLHILVSYDPQPRGNVSVDLMPFMPKVEDNTRCLHAWSVSGKHDSCLAALQTSVLRKGTIIHLRCENACELDQS